MNFIDKCLKNATKKLHINVDTKNKTKLILLYYKRPIDKRLTVFLTPIKKPCPNQLGPVIFNYICLYTNRFILIYFI